MERNIVAKMQRLSNLCGRIDYLSNPKRQEHLFCSFDTAANIENFWKLYSQNSRNQFRKFGNNNESNKCLEAREVILPLPKEFQQKELNEKAKELSASLLQKTIENFQRRFPEIEHCYGAVHYNKTQTNYHMHIIFTERKLICTPTYKIAKRPMYFSPKGMQCRYKNDGIDKNGKEHIGWADNNGQLKNGYKRVETGEIYDMTDAWTAKDKYFKTESFVRDVKDWYAAYLCSISPQKEKYVRYSSRDSPYLKLEAFKKGTPEKIKNSIEIRNSVRRDYNTHVDTALDLGIDRQALIVIKQDTNSDIYEASKKTTYNTYDDRLERFLQILKRASERIKALIKTITLKYKAANSTPKNIVPTRINVIEQPSTKEIRSTLPKDDPETKDMASKRTINTENEERNKRMTIMQKTIKSYLQQTYGLKAHISEMPDGSMKLILKNGNIKSYSCNLFGDIMDYEQKAIVAVGNTHHNLDNAFELPSKWLPVSNPKEADQILRLPKEKIDALIKHREIIVRKRNSR